MALGGNLTIVYRRVVSQRLKDLFVKSGHIIFNHDSVEALSYFNKKFNRGHEYLISGRRTNPINWEVFVVHLIHKLPE